MSSCWNTAARSPTAIRHSVKNDPRVIAAYLGVDDEEVDDVLAEVGDDSVIEQLDGEPDRRMARPSSSMMAGPVSDTIGHSEGERITVADGASKAAQLDARAAFVASRPRIAGQRAGCETQACCGQVKDCQGEARSQGPCYEGSRQGAGFEDCRGFEPPRGTPRGDKADNLTRIKGIGLGQ